MQKLIAVALTSAAIASAATLAFADKQPKMHDAMRHLEEARDSLKDATSDKGGHRVKAIKLVNEAIDEVKAGIAFDDKK